MNCSERHPGVCHTKAASLLGSASLLVIASILTTAGRAYAGDALVLSTGIPEQVLITGSLIPGVAPVGAPVTNFVPRDFARTGSLTTADLFRNFPAAIVFDGNTATDSGARNDRGAKVNLRGLDSGNAPRSLLLIDGVRMPPQSVGLCAIDPSIIPSISLDHVDVLVDGASAVYGSDAVSGVVNLILRRGFDGAMTQIRFTDRAGGGARYQASQLWGRTWDGGQITLSYEWFSENPVKGTAFSNFGVDHSPWGYDNRTPIGSTTPATLNTGNLNATNQLGTSCGYSTGFNPITPSQCYAVPLGTGRDFTGGLGPTAPYSASTLNWTSLSADPNYAGPLSPTSGTRNQFNPYSRGWYSAAVQRNGSAITFDQRLTQDISFFANGFYSNRRSVFLNPSINNTVVNNLLTQVAVPTFNPYYPTGGAPANLRVNYDMGIEMPGIMSSYGLAARYHLGLNIALPAQWAGQIFYSLTSDSSHFHTSGSVNKPAVSAALGWTIAPVAASPGGTGPSFGTWTKPGFVPYLNLFCDPSQFQCNSQTSLDYVTAFRSYQERFQLAEKGVKFDGPLFDLPGGTVKAAIGSTLFSYRYSTYVQDNGVASASNLTIAPLIDAQGRSVWATFAQVNVPVFSSTNAIPFFRRLDLEGSWRHDQYSDFGGASVPKLGFNWAPVDDLTIRGSWGVSFRAPTFGEISQTSGGGAINIGGVNLGELLAPGGATLNANCVPGSGGAGGTLPPLGSAAYKLQKSAEDFNKAMFAAGQPGYSGLSGCLNTLAIPDPGSANPYIDAAGNSFASFSDLTGLTAPSGISQTGPANAALPIRSITGQGMPIRPEQSTNWSIGFDYSPTRLLRGLFVQATYYVIKIDGILRGFGAINSTRFNDSQVAFTFLMPSDVGCPDLVNSAAASIPIPANLVPSACPQFMAMVDGLLASPRNPVSPQARNLMLWVNDNAIRNSGWQKLEGIDWNWSYDWDLGSLGAFNIGQTGTYYLHNYSETVPGAPGSVITDGFHTTVAAGAVNQSIGVPTLPAIRYRGRLGWARGPWNATLFVDYQSHYFHTQNTPPNVNGNFCAPNLTSPGGTFPCRQNAYTNGLPPWYSFDLSIGYDTGDIPANDYLKNIGIQLVVQNIMDKHANYQYRIATVGGQPCTCDILRPNYGRQISLIVSKTW